MHTLLPKLTIVAAMYPFITGFALLGANVAKLDTAPSETVEFIWDGNVPSIEDKDEFYDGQYSGLSDKEFFQQLLNIAFERWNEIPGSYVTMTVTEGSEAIEDSEDNVNSIVISSQSNASTAAFAAPYIEDENPTIIKDCDIVMADRASAARSIAYTLVHEIGHCLGLGHAHSNYNAIMGYSRSKRTLNLGADDIAGLLFLYPDPDVIEDEPKEVVSCSTITAAKGNKSTTAILLLLIFVPFICLAPSALKTAKQRSLR